MTIKHLQPLATIKIVFALILSFFSVFLFFEGTFFGIILLGAALKLSLKEGFELDLSGKKHRKLYSFFAINFGKWENLPIIEYISVFKTIKNSRTRVWTAETTYGFEVYKTNLFYNKNKHLEVYFSEDKEDAFKVANHIAMILDVEIFDATKK